MWRVLGYTRGKFLKKADYTFEKLKDFEKILPYLYKKIEGSWEISLLRFDLKDILHVKEELIVPEYVHLNVYLAKDVMLKFLEKYPELKEKEKSNIEQYKELLASFPKTLTKKAISELYSRLHGNIKRIQETLQELAEKTQDKTVIDIKDINQVTIVNDTVYAKDVLYTFLLYDCEKIPKRGHKLSRYRYRYRKPWDLYEKLVSELGTEYAFYAIRKQVDNLVADKIKYMHNEEYKEFAVEYVDVYALADLYQSFHLYSYNALYVLMNEILRRKRNDSIFKDKTITYYDQLYYVDQG